MDLDHQILDIINKIKILKKDNSYLDTIIIDQMKIIHNSSYDYDKYNPYIIIDDDLLKLVKNLEKSNDCVWNVKILSNSAIIIIKSCELLIKLSSIADGIIIYKYI